MTTAHAVDERVLRVDIHTHILPQEWPDLKEVRFNDEIPLCALK
jgi:hypothetical protein